MQIELDAWSFFISYFQMLVFSNKGKSVKCVVESDEFPGYQNETETIKQMLTNKTKEITAFESTEPAHLSQCNPLTERMWINGVQKRYAFQHSLIKENKLLYSQPALMYHLTSIYQRLVNHDLA